MPSTLNFSTNLNDLPTKTKLELYELKTELLVVRPTLPPADRFALECDLIAIDNELTRRLESEWLPIEKPEGWTGYPERSKL